MRRFECIQLAVSRRVHDTRLLFFVLLAGCSGLFAVPAAAQTTLVPIPFVGCKGDGQVGPEAAPRGGIKRVQIDAAAAPRLAYYKAASGPGVLGPLGWFCFATYGSNGSTLYVSPTPLSSAVLFSDQWKGFTGSAIQLSVSIGDTSGRFAVARMIARVFPSRSRFANEVARERIEPADDFKHEPFPADRMTYRSRNVVEFETAAGQPGLGTGSWLTVNGRPIRGVAILVGETPDLVQLSMRLPDDAGNLYQLVVHQVEADAVHMPR